MMGTINDKASDKRSLITNHHGIHERKWASFSYCFWKKKE